MKISAKISPSYPYQCYLLNLAIIFVKSKLKSSTFFSVSEHAVLCFKLTFQNHSFLYHFFFSFSASFSHCSLLKISVFFFFFFTLCSWLYGYSPGVTCLPIRLVQNILIGALSHISLTLLFCVLFSDYLYENTSFLLLVPSLEPFAGSSRTVKLKTFPWTNIHSVFSFLCFLYFVLFLFLTTNS